MNIGDDGPDIDAMLRHLGSGRDLRDFSCTANQKIALMRTAAARGLIAWRKRRARFELTPFGWAELMPRRRFCVASLMAGAAIGALAGAVALAGLWPSANAPPRAARAQSLQVSRSATPLVRSSMPQPAMLSTIAAEPELNETPRLEPPTFVARAPDPPVAEPASHGTKGATAKKSRHKTAHRRRREHGSPWAYVPSWRGQQFRYAGYGERGFGYR
jgi:hypothetical protein